MNSDPLSACMDLVLKGVPLTSRRRSRLSVALFASVECGTRGVADLRACGVIESFVFKFFPQVDFFFILPLAPFGHFARVCAGVAFTFLNRDLLPMFSSCGRWVGWHGTSGEPVLRKQDSYAREACCTTTFPVSKTASHLKGLLHESTSPFCYELRRFFLSFPR